MEPACAKTICVEMQKVNEYTRMFRITSCCVSLLLYIYIERESRCMMGNKKIIRELVLVLLLFLLLSLFFFVFGRIHSQIRMEYFEMDIWMTRVLMCMCE